MTRLRPGSHVILLCCGSLLAEPALGGGDWVTYTNESSIRMSADASVGLLDNQEKDYDFGDIDQDGDIDLISVRKQPVTTSGGHRNVVFMNENGMLVDQTAQVAPEMLDATNDRDVVLVDVNNDTWLDMVTAAACNGCNVNLVTSESRLYMNLGDGGDGVWDGFAPPEVLFIVNNFCNVDAGDVDGDGYEDLYFVSYNDSTEDQLLMNEGAADPGSFVNGNNRLTSAMLSSNFGTAVEIVDMDNDNDLDIVKSQNGPVEIFRNNGTGVFDLLDPTYGGAAYHMGTGDLDNNGLLDIIIADDGVDRRIMNNGNLLNGAPDPSITFPSATNGFGGNSYVTDLDNDGWNEAVITDIDVDVSGCARVTDFMRNNGGSFSHDSANIPDNQLNGTHDIAVFDVNNDTFKDLVIGRCSSTQIWVNSPPSFAQFAYPDGLPDFTPPGFEEQFTVELTAVGSDITPGTEMLHVSIQGGAYTQIPLTSMGGGTYEAVLPPAECGETINFFVSLQLDSGLSFRDPPNAPAETYQAVAAEGIEVFFDDDIEGDVSGWTVVNDPALAAGAWEQAVPNSTTTAGQIAAPAEDATVNGTQAWVTENAPEPGAVASSYDVDEGPTTLYTPVIDLADADGFVKFSVWAFSDGGTHDVLQIDISNDGGQNWTLVETIGETDSAWETREYLVSELIPPTSQIQMRFHVCDCPNDSITEGGLDDFSIERFLCGGAQPCPWDLDDSGSVDTADFLDLLAQWGAPGPADFDNSGAVDAPDFLELLANWGDCP